MPKSVQANRASRLVGRNGIELCLYLFSKIHPKNNLEIPMCKSRPRQTTNQWNFLAEELGEENQSLLYLIASFLRTPIVDKTGDTFSFKDRGIPQGSPISPFFMNFYLSASLRSCTRKSGAKTSGKGRMTKMMVRKARRRGANGRFNRKLKQWWQWQWRRWGGFYRANRELG